MSQQPKKKQGIWVWLGSIGVFLMTMGKTLFTLLKASKFGVTFLTMMLSIGVYAIQFPFTFAIGIVALIFIHELGHVWAAKEKGLPTSAPIFIPFLGALITMKKHPKDAVTEAYIALGGPVVGTFGAIVFLWVGLVWDLEIFIVLSYVGFFINLINLLPIHPLDGGRIVTAVSRWLWLVGLIGGLAVIIWLKSVLFFIIWVLFAIDLYKRFIKNKKKMQYVVGFEVSVEYLTAHGCMIPGESHRRDLNFTTYSNVAGEQFIDIIWEGIAFRGTFQLPFQARIDRVHVTGIQRSRLSNGEDKLRIQCSIEYLPSQLQDDYYQVPNDIRWKYGLTYFGLAVFLGYMVYWSHDLIARIV